MITLTQAMSWLNQLEPTHLVQRHLFSIWQINEANIPESGKDKILDTLVRNARESDDPYEHAEVLVNCARIQAERNRITQAHILLETACKIYEQKGDRVRQAVVLWMMSILEWKLLDSLAGHAHARSARGLLEQQARDTLLEGNDNRAWWMLDRIADMDEDLLATPEEAYFWLNQFEGSHLKTPALQVVDVISAALREKQFHRVYQLVSSLVDITRTSSDPMETAEALAYCGMVNAQMGNTREAIRFLRQAISRFQPESHHQVAARWMLGMVLFTQPLETNQAVVTCNLCITHIDQLKARAVQRNRPQEEAWYEKRAALMRKILNKKMKSVDKTF